MSGAEPGAPVRLPWALLWLLATRLALRERPAGRRLGAIHRVALLVTVASGGALLFGVSELALVVAFGVASLVVLATTALRAFPPAMAVSVIGIALSCASLLTALAVTTGFLTEVSNTVARFNGHLLLTKYGLDFTEYERMTADISADPRVRAASPFAYSMVVVVRDVDGAHATAGAPVAAPDDDDPWSAAIAADARLPVTEASSTSASDPTLERPAIVMGKGIDPTLAGRFSGLPALFGRGDLSGLRPASTNVAPGVVLGHALRRALGVEIGDRVRVVVPPHADGKEDAPTSPPRHATFEVMDEIRTGVVELDRNLVLMHLTAAQALFFRQGRVTGVEFELHDPSAAPDVAAAIGGRLSAFYRVSTWYEANADMLRTLMQIRVVVAVVLGLMGVVGASSLVASLLLVVRRKHHDIGVLLAVGADPRAMFWTFEAVGLFVGAIGVGLGTALGALYCAVIATYRFPLQSDVYPIDHLPAQIAAADAIVPGTIALVLCACASGPVALLAARIRILTALAR
jgi:lipoprotein-releasing system permease protein